MGECPPEIASLWAKAVKSNCRAAKTVLFKKWLLTGKTFSRPGVLLHAYIYRICISLAICIRGPNQKSNLAVNIPDITCLPLRGINRFNLLKF